MTPELILLAVNGTFVAFAFLVVYPAAPVKTPTRLWPLDLAISGAALATAALLFAGRGQSFTWIGLPWWGFSILSLAAMELPAWAWFLRRHGDDNDN